MPRYLAPGVYVAETGGLPKGIAGVGTGTAAFVGRTARGPDAPEDAALPPLLTSFAEFERHYGGIEDLVAGGTRAPNYLAHAALAFFANGGRRLYVARLPAMATVDAWRDALDRLLGMEDVAIVAAPGASALPAPMPAAINRLLIAHAETPRAYRIALLDPPPDLAPDAVGAFGGSTPSSHAALYYPWVMVAGPRAASGPSAPTPLAIPPSGFVAGIYVRTDDRDGVHTAPANAIVTGALGLQRAVTQAEQGVLNPLGINCIRSFPGRGVRVFGARTLSQDPEWKHVSKRRFVDYLEASIERGTSWAAFEPNGERLWTAFRQAVTDFLHTEWRNGGLPGTTPEAAFFVRCDRSTMSQNDLDNGRLVCLIGLALGKPAEFTIIRVGQKTGDGAA